MISRADFLENTEGGGHITEVIALRENLVEIFCPWVGAVLGVCTVRVAEKCGKKVPKGVCCLTARVLRYDICFVWV